MTSTEVTAKFFSLSYHEGSECNPADRLEAAEKRLAAAQAVIAAGHFLVSDGTGRMRIMDPQYFASQFRPMRWMTADDVAAARRVPCMEVGETVVLADRFHPRHGVKRYSMTRLA
jgi:hypothetical protein